MCLNLKQKIHEERLNLFILKPLLAILLWTILLLLWKSLLTETKTVYIVNPVSVHSAQAQTAGAEVESEAISEVQAKVSEGTETMRNPSTSPATNIEKMVRKAFGSEAENALKVMECESKGNHLVVGDKHLPKPSYGLFQVNVHYNPKYDPQKLLEAEYNVKAAKEIYNGGGWRRWTCGRRLILNEKI